MSCPQSEPKQGRNCRRLFEKRRSDFKLTLMVCACQQVCDMLILLHRTGASLFSATIDPPFDVALPQRHTWELSGAMFLFWVGRIWNCNKCCRRVPKSSARSSDRHNSFPSHLQLAGIYVQRDRSACQVLFAVSSGALLILGSIQSFEGSW